MGFTEAFDDMELANEYGYIAIQADNETREEFFARVEDRPIDLQKICTAQ